MLYIDTKYAQFAGIYIERFKVVKNNPFLARGRCKICGDSKKSRAKTRFYFYEKDGKINCQCHNCGWSSSLKTYLETYENHLYAEYNMEMFKERFGDREPTKAPEFEFKELPSAKKYTALAKLDEFGLPSVYALDTNHPTRKYVESRSLPKSVPILYAENFCKFASKYKEDFANAKKDHARIVIPFIDDNGSVYGFQARALGEEIPKYYTIFIDEEKPKIYGLEKLNAERNVYIVEGPIDSLFIPNCVAALSSNLQECANKISCLINKHLKGFVLVYDNEPRNKEIVKLYDKSIESNYNVVLWPSSFKYKDINAAIIGGMHPREIFTIIKENTFSGLEAKLRFAYWKQV